MDYIDTYVQFEKLKDYHTFGRGMVVYLHYKNERIEKRFSCVVDAMKYAIEREQAIQFLTSSKLTRTPYTKTGE